VFVLCFVLFILIFCVYLVFIAMSIIRDVRSMKRFFLIVVEIVVHLDVSMPKLEIINLILNFFYCFVLW
jgi:hypothetical protein